MVCMVFAITVPLSAQTILESTLNFDTDKYKIRDEGSSELSQLYQQLTNFKDYHIEIVGHTDQSGSDAYNMVLSEKRAEAVKDQLMELGISNSDISISFKGESDLISRETDAVSKQKNRRVSILAKGYSYNNASELVSQLQVDQSDQFSIDHEKKTKVILKKGTKVIVPKDAFCALDGSPLDDSPIDLYFEEAFDYLAMVDKKLFTQTEDQMIETGGMVFIDASQNGVPVKLKEGKKIELMLPEQDLKDGMEIFVGRSEGDGTIWEETGEAVTTRQDQDEAPFVQVDLTPITSFDFSVYAKQDLGFGPMEPYPHPLRKVYPPLKDNYTEEGYAEAMEKYENAKRNFELEKEIRPDKLDAWHKEVEKRRAKLVIHKKNIMRREIVNTIQDRIKRVVQDKDRISHDRLLKVFFSFLDNDVESKNYDDESFLRYTYGGELGNVIKFANVGLPAYEDIKASSLVGEFVSVLKYVNDQINRELNGEEGMNVHLVSRYVVATSKLGWINCDRFIRLDEDQRMDLEFAKTSENTN